MNRKDWESWLQISSTIAVLGGVVLVIAQLRQNAELIELQILKEDANSYFESVQENLPDNMLEIWQKSHEDPTSLTLLEFRAMDSELWSSTVSRWRGLYDLADRDLLDHAVWQRAVIEECPGFLANPFGRAYWERIKDWETTLPAELIEFVDAVLADAPDNKVADQYADVMRRIESAN